MTNIIRTPDVSDGVHAARVKEIEMIRAEKISTSAQKIGDRAVRSIVATTDEAAWLKWRDINPHTLEG